MELDLWKALGLAANEVKIYETLLGREESSVAFIVTKTKIHRRSVYDSLNRLIEKGLVYEVLHKKESRFQAVEPNKLVEILEEKQRELSEILPRFLSLYGSRPSREEVFIYRGLEAYKNEMRDVLRIGKDMYTFGGKGLWTDPRLKTYLKQFTIEARKKNIRFHVMWDHEVGDRYKILTKGLLTESKLLPAKFSSPSVVDIFGDHVVVFSKGTITSLDEDIELTVIVNQRIADTFRIWFRLIWGLI